MYKKPDMSKMIPRALMFAGLAIVLGALAFEAYHYPWSVLFGAGDQSDTSVPDPTPIVLEKEDEDAAVVDIPAETATPVSSEDPAQTDSLPGDEKAETSPLSSYTQLGVFKIPKLNVSVHLLEGTQRQMRYGVGHVTGSEGVGQQGNCAIAGHRPYPFRYLDKLVSGDSIIIKSDETVFTYTVYESLTVLPSEVWVLYNVAGEDYALTLITCTPYLVSSHRLIVRARLTDIDGMTPEEYYGTPAAEAAPSDTAEEASSGTLVPSSEETVPIVSSFPEPESSVTLPPDPQPTASSFPAPDSEPSVALSPEPVPAVDSSPEPIPVPSPPISDVA